MTLARALVLVEEINISFAQMEGIFDNLREHVTTLASLRRRKLRVGSRCLPFELTNLTDKHISWRIDGGFLNRINLSFDTSIADTSDVVFESLNLLRKLSLNTCGLCSALAAGLKQAVETCHCSLFLYNKTIEILIRLTENLVNEVDLISWWIYSIVIPDLISRCSFHSIHYSLSCFSAKMMTCTLWRKDIHPHLIQFCA